MPFVDTKGYLKTNQCSCDTFYQSILNARIKGTDFGPILKVGIT